MVRNTPPLSFSWRSGPLFLSRFSRANSLPLISLRLIGSLFFSLFLRSLLKRFALVFHWPYSLMYLFRSFRFFDLFLLGAPQAAWFRFLLPFPFPPKHGASPLGGGVGWGLSFFRGSACHPLPVFLCGTGGTLFSFNGCGRSFPCPAFQTASVFAVADGRRGAFGLGAIYPFLFLVGIMAVEPLPLLSFRTVAAFMPFFEI